MPAGILTSALRMVSLPQRGVSDRAPVCPAAERTQGCVDRLLSIPAKSTIRSFRIAAGEIPGPADGGVLAHCLGRLTVKRLTLKPLVQDSLEDLTGR